MGSRVWMESPARAGGPGLRTLLNQGGRVPATSGSSGAPGLENSARDDHNSGTWSRDLGKLSVRKIRARSNTAGDSGSVRLKQLVLLRDRRVELGFELREPALCLAKVEAAADLHGEEFVRDVQRRHDRHAVGAADLARLLDLAHFAVQVGDGLHQRLALAVLAGHLVAAPEQAD